MVPRARKCRRKAIAIGKAGPVGQGGVGTRFPWGTEMNGKAARDRKEISFGALCFSLSLVAEELSQPYPILEGLLLVFVQDHCPGSLLAIVCPHREHPQPILRA